MLGFRLEQVVRTVRNRGIASTVRLIINRIKKEGGVSVPLRERFWLSRHGFKPISFLLYGFGGMQPSRRCNYLSDRAAFLLGQVNGEAGAFMRNKLVFHRMCELGKTSALLPPLVGVIRSGRFIANDSQIAAADTASLLGGREPVFFKPTTGCRGEGVRLYEQAPAASSLSRFEGEAVVVGRVQQASYSAHIFPRAFNTVRIVSMRSPTDGSVFIPVAVHRFGTDATAPVDNWSQGGLSCHIDVESGVMGPGRMHPSKTEWIMRDLEVHPGTGARLAGERIPLWGKLLEVIDDLMSLFKDLRFVAWDMLPTDQGWCVIEGNDIMDVDLLQIHGGLLRDPRVREFVGHHCPSALPVFGQDE